MPQASYRSAVVLYTCLQHLLTLPKVVLSAKLCIPVSINGLALAGQGFPLRFILLVQVLPGSAISCRSSCLGFCHLACCVSILAGELLLPGREALLSHLQPLLQCKIYYLRGLGGEGGPTGPTLGPLCFVDIDHSTGVLFDCIGGCRSLSVHGATTFPATPPVPMCSVDVDHSTVVLVDWVGACKPLKHLRCTINTDKHHNSALTHTSTGTSSGGCMLWAVASQAMPKRVSSSWYGNVAMLTVVIASLSWLTEVTSADFP